MRHRALAFALVVSLSAHVALFAVSVWFGGGGKARAVKTDLPTLSVKVPVPRQSKEVKVGGTPGLQVTPALATDSKHPASPASIGKELETERASPVSMVLLADALDAEPQAIFEPTIEPDYGFADDVGGRVVLALLVNGSGSVVWVGVESSEVDKPTTEYLLRAFGVAAFQAPTFRGRPVYALLRVEVDIPRKTTQINRRGLH